MSDCHGTLSREYRRSGKMTLSGGHGGFFCPCCNDFHNPKKAKKKVRRILRRKKKQELVNIDLTIS